MRSEKIAHKDQRLRTFITHDAARKDLVQHIYDITRETVNPDDTLVVVDDSIVRGTTLRESVITMLARLNPRNILVVSASPPIMYPDCYGIDMSQLGRFIAFEAAVALARERGLAGVLDEIEAKCLEQVGLPNERLTNQVGALYGLFTLADLEAKVAQLIRSSSLQWSGGIDLVYQSIDGLRAAIPEHTGDWYFTGEYPTPGGYRVLNTARWVCFACGFLQVFVDSRRPDEIMRAPRESPAKAQELGSNCHQAVCQLDARIARCPHHAYLMHVSCTPRASLAQSFLNSPAREICDAKFIARKSLRACAY